MNSLIFMSHLNDYFQKVWWCKLTKISRYENVIFPNHLYINSTFLPSFLFPGSSIVWSLKKIKIKSINQKIKMWRRVVSSDLQTLAPWRRPFGGLHRRSGAVSDQITARFLTSASSSSHTTASKHTPPPFSSGKFHFFFLFCIVLFLFFLCG